MERNQQISQEENIDIKSIFFKILDHWYLFFITGLLLFTIAFVFLRYSDSVYSVDATILVKEKGNNKGGTDNILQGLDLWGNSKNLENEIGILSSYFMIDKALKKLHFEVSYFIEGKVRHFEVYNECPFKVILDPAHNQIIYTPFYLDIIDDSTFTLELKKDGVENHVFYNESTSKSASVKLQFKKKYKFGDTCKTKYFNFTIVKNKNSALANRKDNEDRLYFTINKFDNITRRYLSKLKITPINKKASIVKLEIEGKVLQKEIDFLNKLSEEYILSNLEEKNRIAINTITFIDEQLFEVSRSLVGAEDQLEKYRSSNKVMNLDASTLSAFENLNDLDNEKAMLMVKNKYYNYLLKYVNEGDNLNTIVAPSSMGINDPLLVSLINELNGLYSQKAALGFSTENKNPTVNILNEKIRNAKQTLAENLKNIVQSSEISLNDIEGRIKKSNELIKKLPKTERELVSIQRKFNLNDHIYNYLLEKRAEAGIAKAANTPDNKILDIAKSTAGGPIYPKRNFIYTLCIIASLLIPLLYIAGKSYFNDKVQGKEDLLKLSNIPLLGIIGHNKNESNSPLLEFPKSAISESFRSLRINLQYLNSSSHTNTKVIGITSTISGEGKTFSALNLATAIAISGSKTIIIGADLRKPKLANQLNLSNEIGLSLYLINQKGIKEIIQSSTISNLDVIVAGPIPPNPAELLGSEGTDNLFAFLKETYDYIIIDSPPIALVADYYILTKHIDSHLYIVRNNYTKRKSLVEINEVYNRGDLNKVFLVLNDVRFNSSKYGYGYGYGYGYYEEGKKKKKNIKVVS